MFYLLCEKFSSLLLKKVYKSYCRLSDNLVLANNIHPVYCHPAYLTYMQSTSCEMLGWRKHKLESRLPGEISITSDIQMT